MVNGKDGPYFYSVQFSYTKTTFGVGDTKNGLFQINTNPDCFGFQMDYLNARGVDYACTFWIAEIQYEIFWVLKVQG